MHLVVFSHKDIWPDEDSETGYVTDGGFPFQMKAISELFDQTTLVLPLAPTPKLHGLIPLCGHQIKILPLSPIKGKGWRRKLFMPFWFLRNAPRLWRIFKKGDAIHAAIPGDVGTVGMLFGSFFRKNLFVRYCGNWMVTKTFMERFWKWFMRRCDKPNQVMLATGAAVELPSPTAPHVKWIFSTSLDENQMKDLRTNSRVHPGTAPRFIIVSRQERAKGTAILIEALHALLPKFPDLSLEIVGDGSGLGEFKEKAKQLGMANRVTFLGKIPQPQVIERLKECHLFCFPTYSSEGFPKVVLEALASGLPVVTTKVSALPLVLSKGGGVLMEEASPNACRFAIEKALASPQHYLDLSKQAFDVAKQYSLDAWRDEIGRHLQSAWNVPLSSHSGNP